MSKFKGCSHHIQQPAAANFYRKSYIYMLNAAALLLQPVVMNFDVSPNPLYHILPFTPCIISYLSLLLPYPICHPLYHMLTVIPRIIFYLSPPVSYPNCHPLYHILPVTTCQPLYHILPVSPCIISYLSPPVSYPTCHPLYHILPVTPCILVYDTGGGR